ncbi:MAG: NADH-quinone oxidoreductase subunit H, partial [Planctomycetes bacterium]|nr:NADH-quinone oxidoreductase subunit H [Planctomycetota bacterium]
MELGWCILVYAAAAAGTLALGLAFKWVDRLVTARVQWRVGPPWYQPGADILKLMGKESLMPLTARGTGFLLAPLGALAAAGTVAAILWPAVIDHRLTFLGDLIVVVYLLAIPAIMTIVGASASGNPHASIGASREIKLLLSYE